MKIILMMLLIGGVSSVKCQNAKDIVVNPLRDDTSQLTSKIFKYKDYQDGIVVFGDSDFVAAKMNLNRLSDKILFINPKSDTLVLAKPETFSMVIIESDTFYYKENTYLEKITHYATCNLAVSRVIKLIGREKKGAYGTYTATASINSNTTFTNDDQITNYLGVDERAIFRLSETFYISDKFNNFFIANKKNFNKIFFNYEKEIKGFVNLNKVNFSKSGDIKNLLNYIQGLN
ncbi:MAG: hypothetical protein ABJB11_05730 [Ferruginibacter sp.]